MASKSWHSLQAKIISIPRHRWILVFILLGAIIIRLLGILWGLPYADRLEGIYHPDERKIIESALEFPEHIQTNTDLRYPTFMHYSLGIVIQLIEVSTNLLSIQFPIVFVRGYLLGRLFSVLVGAGAIVFVFLYGKREYDEKVALLASFFTAFSLYHVQASSWATVDGLSAFLMIAFIFFTTRAVLYVKTKAAYLLAGIFFGLLMGTRYTGVIGLIAFITLYIADDAHHVSSRGAFTSIKRILFDTRLIVFVVSAVLIFFLTTPGLIISPDIFFQAFTFEQDRLMREYIPMMDVEAWIRVISQMSDALSLPLAMTAFVGMLYPWSGRKPAKIAIVTVIISFLLLSMSTLRTRYITMFIPLLCLLAAEALINLSRSSRKVLRVIGTWLIVGFGLFIIMNSLLGVLPRLNDTRTQAAHFIEESVPPGASIGIGQVSVKYDWTTHPWRYPYIDLNDYEELSFLSNPDYIVISSFDLDQIIEGLNSEYIQDGYVWPEKHRLMWYRGSPPTPQIFEKFISLKNQENYCLLREFQSNVLVPIEFPPPDIAIYEKKTEPDFDCNDG